MNLAVFQTVGPLELLIVLGIVLVIFGPKRLPALGRQLGAGMREFRDSVTGKAEDDDEDDDDAATPAQRPRREAAAAPGAPRRRRRAARSTGSPPRSASAAASAHGHHPRPIRHEDRLSLVEHLDELRKRLIICVRRVRRLLRRLPVAGRRGPRHHQPPARADGVQGQEASNDPFERTAAFQRSCASARARSRRRSTALAPRPTTPATRGAATSELAAETGAARRVPRGGAAAGDARRRGAVHGDGAGSPPTRRCCSRCRSCSTRPTRSCCRRSRRGSGRSRCR